MRVRPLPDVRLPRAVLGDASTTRRASPAGSSSTSRSLARVYRLHRRMLQTFQATNPDSSRRAWLLKSPAHVSTLPELFARVSRRARVIHTHRDPRRFLASLVSILSAVRFMRSDDVDVDGARRDDGGRRTGCSSTARSRSEPTARFPNDQIVDSHFLDLMADPVASLRSIYEQLELDWPAGHDRVITDYLATKPKASTARTRTRSPTSASTKHVACAATFATTSRTTASPRSEEHRPHGLRGVVDVALGRKKRQNTRPNGRPSVSSQFGTPGSRCAITTRNEPSAFERRSARG